MNASLFPEDYGSQSDCTIPVGVLLNGGVPLLDAIYQVKQAHMRIIFVISGILALVRAIDLVCGDDIVEGPKEALNKFLGSMGKIYDRCDDRRRDMVTAAKGMAEGEGKRAAIARLISMSIDQLRDAKTPEYDMINLHTLHAAESVIKKESKWVADAVHKMYQDHALIFQNDTWVRGFIFGSLGVVFLLAAYQGTARKFA